MPRRTPGGAASSSYERIGLKFRGLNDDAHRCNAEAREAIGVLADMFDPLGPLELRVAESEADESADDTELHPLKSPAKSSMNCSTQ